MTKNLAGTIGELILGGIFTIDKDKTLLIVNLPSGVYEVETPLNLPENLRLGGFFEKGEK